MKKTVLLGVTSGIAAFKTLELIKELQKENLNIVVTMSQAATKMVSVEEFEKASGNKVLNDLFEPGFDYKKILETRVVEHIQIADKADVMVIAPLTANTLAKLTQGMADDYLTTTALAVTAPVILCPSMNVNMWNNPLVQENIAKLKQLGYIIIEPEIGALACGYEGKGRLADIQKIKDTIMQQLSFTTSLKNKKILITAGGTTEKIDDVRSITNRSSGKMGVALAEACYRRGADVLLLRANNAVEPRYLLQQKIFTSADELEALMKKHIADYDIVFHTAAVADFQVTNQPGKLSSDQSVTLTLTPRGKIIDQIKQLNPKIKLIAFKAEHGLSENELITKATQRLQDTNADAIVANDVSQIDRGFESDNNQVFIILKNKEVKKIPLASKQTVAKEILDYLQIHLI